MIGCWGQGLAALAESGNPHHALRRAKLTGRVLKTEVEHFSEGAPQTARDAKTKVSRETRKWTLRTQITLRELQILCHQQYPDCSSLSHKTSLKTPETNHI